MAQRATSVTDVGGSQGYFCTDRFKSTLSGTELQDILFLKTLMLLHGFSKALKYDVTTADTSVAMMSFMQYHIEQRVKIFLILNGEQVMQRNVLFSFYAKATGTDSCCKFC